ncbi:hypothetical protein [Rhizobium terrae]|uniref:hypothetical protein n=1 Tax=Rhizobium terrae TaxID=2171756 RepID=UPI000E3E1F93|nr:hypothetical protein [Rhizobium terrae]
MEREFAFVEFEECVAYFKAHPPAGERVELDFSEEELQRVRDHAAHYGCSIDVFLAAVMACFMTETERRNRLAAEDDNFAEVKAKLRQWVLAEAKRQGQEFARIEAGTDLLLDDFIRAAFDLGFRVELHTSEAAPGETRRLTVTLPH